LRRASFKGGEAAWQKYLQKHLNNNAPADAGLPAGDYVVELEFNISKEGYISNVKVVNGPSNCKPCTAEAISVITEGTNWDPAIVNNEPAVSRLSQRITFNLTDKKRKH
jgi:protein TonB